MKTETAVQKRSTSEERVKKRLASSAYWVEFAKKWLWSIIRFVLIFGISFVIVYPILLKLSIAFKSMDDLYDSTVIWVPQMITLDNFKLVFKAMNYPSVLLNTLLLSSLVMLLIRL
jgi:multiple sugar transport system permease protein